MYEAKDNTKAKLIKMWRALGKTDDEIKYYLVILFPELVTVSGGV